MDFQKKPKHNIQGKTYSLYGPADTSDEYYSLIRTIADDYLPRFSSITQAIQELRSLSKSRSRLKKISQQEFKETQPEYIVKLLAGKLHAFTRETASHLRTLPFYKKFWDRRLGTTEEQYHLYMLEIELVNRCHKSRFRQCQHKIALLPYCLKDFSTTCRSIHTDFDYECRHCSKNCFINLISNLFNGHQIRPYVWSGGGVRKLHRQLLKKNETLGIFGIACVPELVWGMRVCGKLQIPVMGLPLDANRCIRWFGAFHENTVNLSQLLRLLAS